MKIHVDGHQSRLAGGLEHVLFSIIYGMSTFPVTFIFFRGVGITTNQQEKIGSKQILMKGFLVWDDVNAQTNTMFSPWHQWHP